MAWSTPTLLNRITRVTLFHTKSLLGQSTCTPRIYSVGRVHWGRGHRWEYNFTALVWTMRQGRFSPATPTGSILQLQSQPFPDSSAAHHPRVVPTDRSLGCPSRTQVLALRGLRPKCWAWRVFIRGSPEWLLNAGREGCKCRPCSELRAPVSACRHGSFPC